MEPARKSVSKDLDNQFCKAMDQTDSVEILDMRGFFYGKECKCSIEKHHVSKFSATQCRNCSHNIIIYDCPAGLVEAPSNLIRMIPKLPISYSMIRMVLVNEWVAY
jgi:hypothetical protein